MRMVSFTTLRRKLRNVSISKFVCVLLLTTIVINEFLVYSLQAYRWTSVFYLRNQLEDDVIVLFVADPQLIGLQDEMGFPIGSLARWDSDRYLRNTFSRAYEHTSPDVIVFLGDLLDEGSKATKDEFLSYVNRFNNIFYEKNFAKTVILPGDNDIGGEGADLRTPFKIARFEKHFQAIQGVVNMKFVDFIKLDIRHYYGFVEEKRQTFKEIAPSLTAPFKIIVNHEAVITKRKENIFPVLKDAQPSIIVSAHWHWSLTYLCPKCMTVGVDSEELPYHKRDVKEKLVYEEFDLTDAAALNEIMVPTCSYRMGVPSMGYGVAVITETGIMRYTVLWLPSRYTILYIYVIVLINAAILLILEFIFGSCRKPQKYRGR